MIHAFFKICNRTKVLDRKLMWSKLYSVSPLVDWNDTKIKGKNMHHNSVTITSYSFLLPKTSLGPVYEDIEKL